jgi:hypothetical protein
VNKEDRQNDEAMEFDCVLLLEPNENDKVQKDVKYRASLALNRRRFAERAELTRAAGKSCCRGRLLLKKRASEIE